MNASDIPDGLCQCGCGQPTKIATLTRLDKGRIKGQPLRYLQGHIGGINAQRVYEANLV
jgi:hypothetical protein